MKKNKLCFKEYQHLCLDVSIIKFIILYFDIYHIIAFKIFSFYTTYFFFIQIWCDIVKKSNN